MPIAEHARRLLGRTGPTVATIAALVAMASLFRFESSESHGVGTGGNTLVLSSAAGLAALVWTSTRIRFPLLPFVLLLVGVVPPDYSWRRGVGAILATFGVLLVSFTMLCRSRFLAEGECPLSCAAASGWLVGITMALASVSRRMVGGGRFYFTAAFGAVAFAVAAVAIHTAQRRAGGGPALGSRVHATRAALRFLLPAFAVGLSCAVAGSALAAAALVISMMRYMR